MPTDTDITLLDPKQALANISRDELVNLIVDDFLTRAEEAEKEANKRANELDLEAAQILLNIYTTARESLLSAAKLHGDVLHKAVAEMGYKNVIVEYGPLPTQEQVSATNGLFDRTNYRDGRASERSEMTLVEAINSLTLGVRPSKPVYVDIGFTSNEVGSYLNTSIRFRAPLPDVDMAPYNAKREAATKHKKHFEAIKEAQNPEKLRRKALANLTREALERGNVGLPGVLPAAPLALPLAP